MSSQQVIILIFAAVALYAVITGFMKGLLSQIGQIAGLVIGVLAARALTPSLITMLRGDAGVDTTSMIVTVLCYILVYLAAYFSVVLVARFLRLVVRVACLGALDRIGGALFKLLKWMLIMSLVYNLAMAVCPSQLPPPSDNFFIKTLSGLAPALLDMCR